MTAQWAIRVYGASEINRYLIAHNELEPRIIHVMARRDNSLMVIIEGNNRPEGVDV